MRRHTTGQKGMLLLRARLLLCSLIYVRTCVRATKNSYLCRTLTRLVREENERASSRAE